jgi:hypothetical protein
MRSLTPFCRTCNGICLRMRRRKAPSSGTLPLYFDDEGQSMTRTWYQRKTRRGRGSWPKSSWLWMCLPAGFVLTMAGTWWVSHLAGVEYPQSPTRVTCPNGSIGYLNDDYCDCLEDGSDEPNTSACSHVLVQQPTFHCADGTAIIFASRVKDGVRDCLDGSDEQS